MGEGPARRGDLLTRTTNAPFSIQNIPAESTPAATEPGVDRGLIDQPA